MKTQKIKKLNIKSMLIDYHLKKDYRLIKDLLPPNIC